MYEITHLKYNCKYFLKNGGHIILFSFLLYYMKNDFKLSMYIYLKWFSYNYHYWFLHSNTELKLYKWKHMVRLTDSGHIANFIFYFNPSFLPVAHNVLFVITFLYYGTTYFLNMKDLDTIENNEINPTLQNIHGHLNHIAPYCIVVYSMYESKRDEMCYYEFNDNTYWYSALWINVWFMFVYIPWVYNTGDYLYSILDEKSPLMVKGGVIISSLLIVFIANQIGIFIHE
jgi:hypothetical protein